MKGNKRRLIKLILTVALCTLFTANGFPGEPVGEIGPAADRRDGDWDYWSHSPDMFSLALGNIGIGGVPPSGAQLYVKTRNPFMDHAIYAEGGHGIRAVATIWEGTGITGEGGHAGVCGYGGYIGLLGYGFYGGWFEGNGYFSGDLGIGTEDPESTLHVNGAINLDPIGEPAAPATGFVIYCDSTDGKLKAKSSMGQVSTLADP